MKTEEESRVESTLNNYKSCILSARGYLLQALSSDPKNSFLNSNLDIINKLKESIDTSTPYQNGFRNLNDLGDDFECTWCMKLLFEPVTTPCGHTFCRNCLIRILDHSPHCPTCKESIHFNLNHSVNYAMNNIINKFFPEMVKIRELEEMESTDQSALSLPLFLLNAVCVPEQDFHLHIYEPRYRLMLRRCMAGQKQFGLVSCLQNESGTWEMCTIGICLKITHFQMLADGRSLVTTKATQRFQVLEHWDLDGYKVGKIEWVNDLPEQLSDDFQHKALYDKIMSALRNTIINGPSSPCEALRSIASVMQENLHSAPQNYDKFSWWLVSTLPMAISIKISLLSTTSTLQRLQMVHKLLTCNPHATPPNSEQSTATNNYSECVIS